MPDYFDAGGYVDTSVPADTSAFTDYFTPSTSFDSSAMGLDTGPSAPDAGVVVDMSGVNLFDSSTQSTVPAGDVSATPVAVDATGVDWGKIVSGISTVAVAALKLVPAFANAGHPAIQVGSTRLNPDGSTSTVNANGTLTTHSPSGAVSTSALPKGIPYVLTDGSIVTNNGNGTYTIVRPNGTTATVNYAAGVSGANPMLLYGGAAVLALLLLSRRSH